MFSTKRKLVIISLLNIFGQIISLVELPTVQDNNIIQTEKDIRDTINLIFTSLKFKKDKDNKKLKNYGIVHNYLVSLTLQDDNNLKEIAKLTRVDYGKFNNITRKFISALNEDIEQTEILDYVYKNENIVNHIENFLSDLNNLKQSDLKEKQRDVINLDVLKYLGTDDLINFSNTSESSKNNLLDQNEFWNSELSGRRIFQSKTTKIKHFPFVASVQFFNKFQCAGSIIKSDLIITASSCLQLAWNNRFFRENPAFLSVRVGSDFPSLNGETIPVLEIYFHPTYNPRTLHNNLAILRLDRHLNFKRKEKRVKKIDIDRNPSSLPLTTAGIAIVGWGAKRSGNKINEPWKNKISFDILDVYPLDDCQDIYSMEYVTKKNFCAGFLSRGGGACNHDVGAPGVVNGLLTGVVSFGSPKCGAPNVPTVFTKLGYYEDWIAEIMEQDVPQLMKRTTLRTTSRFNKPTTENVYKITDLKLEPLLPRKPISLYSTVPTEVSTQKANDLRTVDEELFKEFIRTIYNGTNLEGFEGLLQNPDERFDRGKDVPVTTMNIVEDKSGAYPDSSANEEEESVESSEHESTENNSVSGLIIESFEHVKRTENDSLPQTTFKHDSNIENKSVFQPTPVDDNRWPIDTETKTKNFNVSLLTSISIEKNDEDRNFLDHLSSSQPIHNSQDLTLENVNISYVLSDIFSNDYIHDILSDVIKEETEKKMAQ